MSLNNKSRFRGLCSYIVSMEGENSCTIERRQQKPDRKDNDQRLTAKIHLELHSQTLGHVDRREPCVADEGDPVWHTQSVSQIIPIILKSLLRHSGVRKLPLCFLAQPFACFTSNDPTSRRGYECLQRILKNN